MALLSLEWPSVNHHTGGVAHYAYRLAARLAVLVDLTVVTLEGGQELPGASVVYLPRSPSRLGRYYRAPLLLRKVVRHLDVDVIHALGDDWALSARGVPVVRTFPGSSLHEARASSGLRRYNHYVLALSEQISARRATVRLAIGVDSQEEFACDYLVPPVVDTLQPPRGTTSAVPRIVFVGPFTGRKRGWLAERLARDASRSLGRPVELVVVGPEADRHHWASTTTVVAGADDDEVARRIANAWLLVAPSTYEGFGLPAFEALTVGVRVVATSNPGADYLGAVVGDPRLFATCAADEQLLPAVLRALEAGPTLSEAESAAASTAVADLTDRGSPDFLVDTVYPLALHRRTVGTGR